MHAFSNAPRTVAYRVLRQLSWIVLVGASAAFTASSARVMRPMDAMLSVMPSDTLIVTGLPTTYRVSTGSYALTLCSPWGDTPDEEAKFFILNANGDTVAMNDTPMHTYDCGVTEDNITMPLVAGPNTLTIKACGGILTYQGTGEFDPDQYSYGCESKQVTFWYDDPTKTYGAAVSPDGANVTHVAALPSSGYTQFTVSRGSATATIQSVELAIVCTGVVYNACAFTAGGGTSKTFNLTSTSVTYGVSYSLGISAGSGTVKLVVSAYNGGPSFTPDTGSVNVTSAETGGGAGGQLQINMREANPGPSISRGACFSIPAGRTAAIECGDLRVVQPLPSTTTMNQERTPTLTYLSRHVVPGPVLGAHVLTGDSISATHLLLIMTIPGVDTVSILAPWNTAWNDSQPRRLALPFNKSLPSGIYKYTMAVWALNNGVPVYSVSLPAQDTLVVVNRANSPFGVGWWLNGLEQLVADTASTAWLWIGGDGSTRIYKQQTSTVWTVSPTLNRPDTLLKVVSGDTTRWHRQLGNGAYVQFDNPGQHIASVNDLGHKTRLVHSGGKLDSLVLPVPSGSNAVPAYAFRYVTVGTPMLDTVHAPKNPSTSHRRVKIARTDRVVTGFTATDGGDVTFTGGSVITGLSDGPTITYGTGTLVTAFAHAGLGTTTMCPVEGTSLLACAPTVLSGNALTWINGPRDSIADTTRIWHTRYGAPRKVRDPLGNETLIDRDNATFPMLVTRGISPTLDTVRTTYTSRGLVDSVIAVNPLGTSQNAVTRHAWHSTFNRVTQITRPTGDVTNFSYDGSGLLTYTEDGRGSSTRTNFFYDAANRVDSVQPPGHSSSQRYTFEYDSYLGNAWKTKTPLGFATETTRDTVGRAVTIVTPIDSNPSSNVKSKRVLTYNAWNCVLTSEDKIYSGTLQPNYVFASIADTARNTDLNISNGCSGPNVTSTTVDGTSHAVSQNVYGRAACAGVTCTYDAAGNVTQMATSAGAVSFKYDGANRLIERRMTSNNVSVYLNPGEQGYTSPLSNGFDFPALGYQFPYWGALTIPADTATFTYDAKGNLLTANNRDARISRSYYPNGAIKTDTLRIRKYDTADTSATAFNTHRYGITYEYDLAGRRTKIQVPTNLGHGCTVGSTTQCFQQYHYLAHLGAIDTITSHLGHKFTAGYDDNGRPTTRTAPGGVDLTLAFDLEGRVTRRHERRNVGGTPVTVHLDSLWYDARGKVTKALLAGVADTFQIARFQYDRHGYLAASEFVRTASGQDTTNQVFTLGPTGNLTQIEKNKNLGSTLRTFTYDEGRLTAQSQYASGTEYPFYGIDFSAAAGAKALKSALQYDDTWPYQTGKGYESAAWHQSDGKIRYFQRVGHDSTPETRFVFEEYRYDALGRRVLLRSLNSGGCSASFCKAAVERFVWDGSQVLFEMRVPGADGLSSAALETDTSTVSAHYGRVGYVHGTGIDAPVGLYRNGVALIPHANWRGFYDAATDTSGAAVTSTITRIAREADPYMDNQLPRTVNGWAGSLWAAGQDQSGLFYRRNRYYDASTGAFTQTDPIGLDGGANLYGYAAGDPINQWDPFGTNPLVIGGYVIWITAEGVINVIGVIGAAIAWSSAIDAARDKADGATSSGCSSDALDSPAAADATAFARRNPKSVKKEWEAINGQPWPPGKVAHHTIPLADGGADNGSNVEPKDPKQHIDDHKNNGDFKRWGQRGCKK